MIYTFPYISHVKRLAEIANNLVCNGMNVIVDTDPVLYYMFDEKIKKKSCLYRYAFHDLGDEKEALMKYAEGVLAVSDNYYEIGLEGEIDLIIHDSMAFWGGNLARKYNIRTLSIITNQPFKYIDFINEGFDFLCSYSRKYESAFRFYRDMYMYQVVSRERHFLDEKFVISDILCMHGNINLVLTYKEMCRFPSEEYYYFPLENKQEMVENRDGVYISTGSLINRKEFLECCVFSLLEIGKKIYVSAGDYRNDIKRKYPKVIAYKYAPQIDILSHCELFITHAGMNSINEGICNCIPMICIPFMNDQFLNSKMVEKNHYGICVDYEKMNNIYDLKNIVETILYDKSYIEQLKNRRGECKKNEIKLEDVLELIEQICM